MKKLVLTAIVAATASQAAGCIISSDDDPGGDPIITADIRIFNEGPATTIDCVEGDGIRVNAQLSGTNSGYSDVYPCNTVSLATPPLRSGFGDYDVWVDYINDRGLPAEQADQWVVVDATETVRVNVQADLHVDADLTLRHGFFAANWSLSAANGTPITSCDDIPDQDGVSILSTVAGTTQGFEDIFTCEDGFNNPNPTYTLPLLLDDYVISVSLIDGGNPPLAIGAAPDQNGTILNGNEYSDLGVVDIQLF
jgi:hypothetical protein